MSYHTQNSSRSQYQADLQSQQLSLQQLPTFIYSIVLATLGRGHVTMISVKSSYVTVLLVEIFLFYHIISEVEYHYINYSTSAVKVNCLVLKLKCPRISTSGNYLLTPSLLAIMVSIIYY